MEIAWSGLPPGADHRGSVNVGQPIQAADPLLSGSSRLKAGCRQDCLPHNGCQVL